MNYIYRRFVLALVVPCCASYASRPLVGQINLGLHPSNCICCLASRMVVENAVFFNTPDPPSLGTQVVTMPLTASSSLGASSATPLPPVTSNLGSFQIALNPNASLAGNAPALAAFNRAAAKWMARISDPITVNIDVNLESLGPGIIGAAGSQLWAYDYTDVRDAMIYDSGFEADDGIVNSLPSTFTATMPSGFSLNGLVAITQANAKALGATFTGADGAITFSSNFQFDYDNSDGVTPGYMDFETVAAHEIGHILGFVSRVDEIDGAAPFASYISPLDMFRFENSVNPLLDPIDATTFAAAARNLVPGADGITDFGDNAWGIGSEFRMSTGLTQGDLRQASHWKDDDITGFYIGMMDPTLNYGTVQFITERDFRALDLIGWDISPIPEPSTYALGAMGIASLLWLRRKRGAAKIECAS